MNNNIIQIVEQDSKLVVDSRLVAKRLDIEHESFIKTIKKYQAKIESRFGQFRFQIGTVTNSVGAVNETKFYWLSEEQAISLMTFSKNTNAVVECKLDLVDAFSRAKNALRSQMKVPQTYIESLEETLRLAKANQALLEHNQNLIAASQKLETKVEVLETEVAIAKPTIQKWELFCSADGWMTGEQICKQLCIPKLSVRVLFDILRKHKFIFRRSDGGINMPYKQWEDIGFAALRSVKCRDNVMRPSLMFSYKSLDPIFDVLRSEGYIPVNSDYQLTLDSQVIEMKSA